MRRAALLLCALLALSACTPSAAPPALTTKPPRTPLPLEIIEQRRAARATPSPVPLATLTLEPLPDGGRVMAAQPFVALLDAPDGSAVFTMTLGQEADILETRDGWARLVVQPGKQLGWAEVSALEMRRSARFVALIPQGFIDSKKYNGRAASLEETLVDVRALAPSLDIRMIFATPENFMGRTLYPRDLCLLQRETALRLLEAEERFNEMGLHLRVYDAYRPASVQRILYEEIQDSRYIANPDNSGSMHNRGAAVDVTLVDSGGNELVMPSPMHTLDASSHRSAKMSAEAKANMLTLSDVMLSCGFTYLSTEWWHFSDYNAKDRPITDYDFSALEVVEYED